MATPAGRVFFEARGASMALQFTTNSLCALEEKTGLTTLEVAHELALGKAQPIGVSKKTLRALFWAGAGDGSLSMADAGDLVDEVGHFHAVGLAIDAFDAAFPDTEAEKTEDSDRPPVAAAG